MDILVVGSGGREHAIIRKLKESPKANTIYCAPGNGGISKDAVCVPVPVMDIPGMVALAKEKKVGMVFVASDDPLAAGMVDAMEAEGIPAFGPRANAAIIEASKVFSKNLMKKYGIPTAGYEVFSDPSEAASYIEKKGSFPIVVKADGLALGKGVLICQNLEEAKKALHEIMEDKVFGASGNQVVIEEFITGPEVSVLAFTDGHCVKPMVSSMDHKRALDGDKGLNTGGMGTISPNPYYTSTVAEECMKTIFLPTIEAMQKEGRPFKGCLYFGLMLTKDGPKVIEYNSRFGDPETQVVLPRLKTDFVDVLMAVIEERLEAQPVEWSEESCACVVMASGGYPGKYDKGIPIEGLDENGQIEGATVYHAGTLCQNGQFLTNGGRVLGITALGNNLEEALDKAYSAVEKINWKDVHFRRDIGRR